ncbi:hypothetical protein ACFX2I_012659 [Malus domestica]
MGCCLGISVTGDDDEEVYQRKSNGKSTSTVAARHRDDKYRQIQQRFKSNRLGGTSSNRALEGSPRKRSLLASSEKASASCTGGASAVRSAAVAYVWPPNVSEEKSVVEPDPGSDSSESWQWEFFSVLSRAVRMRRDNSSRL